jgi:hypothetical protein
VKTLFASSLVVLVLLATASGDEGVVHLFGAVWEDGGLPPSEPGDGLFVVGLVEDVEEPFLWEPSMHSYTFCARDMVSVGGVYLGTTYIASYTGGSFTIYVDSLPPNHSFGIDPPNETVPSTFMDGTSVYLDGVFSDFTVVRNTATGNGSVSGIVDFLGGDALTFVDCPFSWTFGMNTSVVAPEGYDAFGDGELFALWIDWTPCPSVSVEPRSWGGIKLLYR